MANVCRCATTVAPTSARRFCPSPAVSSASVG